VTSRVLLLPCVAAWVVACTGVDPGSPFAGDLGSESSSETGLGTESGNPTGANPGPDVTLGTESGNPGNPPSTEPAEGEEVGTESGNPTRPPPASDGDDVTVTVPIPEDSEAPTEGVEPMAGGAATDGEVTTPPPGSAAPEPSSPDVMPNGATSGGVCDPAACEAEAAAFAAGLAAEASAPAPFSSTSCSESGGVCTCARDDGSLTLTTGDAGSCLVRGRLSCLYSADEYGGCTPTDPSTCEAACSQVQARLEADANGIPAAARASGCGTSGCVYVLSVGDACFVAGSALAPVEIDCSLSDEEALNSR
jgi:hypothetical protein